MVRRGARTSLLLDCVMFLYDIDLLLRFDLERTCNHAFEPNTKNFAGPFSSCKVVNRQSRGDFQNRQSGGDFQNRQSGGDEAKRIGLVGRLHLSICGLGGGAGFA